MAEERRILEESESTFIRLKQLYGDRLSPTMQEELRESVGAVVKTVAALRSVRLENGEAPLAPFTPFRGEE